MRTLAYYLFSKHGASLLICAGLLLLTTGCRQTLRSASSPTPATFSPPVEVYSQLGWISDRDERARLADYKGKVLVLDFYATWCEPCRQSIPRLSALQKQYGPSGLQVVGLNVGGPDDRIKINDFAKQLHIDYVLGFPDKSLTDVFLADDETIPQTFVFARTGQLTKRLIGYQQNTGNDLEVVIKTELARSPN